MVQYDNMDSAKDALSSVKGTFIKNSRRLMVFFIVVGKELNISKPLFAD